MVVYPSELKMTPYRPEAKVLKCGMNTDFQTPVAAIQAPIMISPAQGSSPLLHHLNPPQLAAVTLPARSTMILAGAGSGKTRVLTTRIAWLIQTGQVSPAQVMAVTFTNKAAKEMLTRLEGMLPLPVRRMWIGTFHGLCHRFLRTHWKLAGLPQGFQILDSSDQLSAVKRLIKGLQLDDERFVPKQVTGMIAKAKDDGLRPQDMPVRDEYSQTMVELYQAYEAQCQREGVLDFSELMLRTYELLRDQPALRAHYQQRFRHILVDEFQDTNRLQYAWIKMFADPTQADSGCVMAVGDDDQSIYAFRGALVGNMTDFEREFRVGPLIKLEQNYRSQGNILDAANHLIAHNTKRLGKTLITDAGQGEPVRIRECPSDHAEAQSFVDEARQLHREGMALHNIALLYRSNAQSRVMESALFNAHLPYKVYGGLRFFERAEIKHALSYLRLIENPNDDTSFLRVVNFPARGIGARTLEQLQEIARTSGRSLHQSVSALPGKAGANVAAFVALIDRLRNITMGLSLRESIDHMLQLSGLIEFYKTEKEGQDRIENLEELINAAEAFVMQEGFGKDAVGLPLDHPLDAQSPTPTEAPLTSRLNIPDPDTGEVISPLSAFLTHAALEAGDNQAQAGQDAIQLMTVHAAKGLEFDAVFITGLEEGLFPHQNNASDPDGLEEERRLMYVAITRARQRLYLSFSQTRMLHGQTRYGMKSRFLDELPEPALRWLTPRSSPSLGSSAQRNDRIDRIDRNTWGHNPAHRSVTQGPALAPPPPTGWGAPPQVTASHGLRIGQAVFHTKFGEGVLLKLVGHGSETHAHINFGRHGKKELALSVAKLTPID